MAYISKKKPSHFTIKFSTLTYLRNISIIICVIFFAIEISKFMENRNK